MALCAHACVRCRICAAIAHEHVHTHVLRNIRGHGCMHAPAHLQCTYLCIFTCTCKASHVKKARPPKPYCLKPTRPNALGLWLTSFGLQGIMR